MNPYDQVRLIKQLSAAITVMLNDRGSVFHSAVIADLLSKYLACRPSEHRDNELAKILELAAEMIEPNEKIIQAGATATNERPC